jgi:UTP-glucose-1-phosphate uridylyltransferase
MGRPFALACEKSAWLYNEQTQQAWGSTIASRLRQLKKRMIGMMKLTQASLTQKVVFPNAGLGCRFLLSAKTPLGNLLPAIQFTGLDAVVSALADLIASGDRTNRAVADHSGANPALGRALRSRDNGSVAESCRSYPTFGHLTKRTIGQ